MSYLNSQPAALSNLIQDLNKSILIYTCVGITFSSYLILPFVFFLGFFVIVRQANIADYGDNQWVTCFQESAEAILGQNAAYLGQLKDSVRLSFLNIILAS